MRVTNLKQGVKNPNRVNVFIDGKYDFSLDVAQVVDFKLKVGTEVSEEELLNLRHASEFGKLYQRALEWALTRPRSERETRDYLKRKIKAAGSVSLARETAQTSARSSEEVLELSDKIIQRLQEKKYLNDEVFARYFVENRFVKKGVSRRRLEQELLKKGVAREAIERVLNESVRDDTEEIKKIIARKRARYDDEKLISYLCRQGFSYELVRSLVSNPETD